MIIEKEQEMRQKESGRRVFLLGAAVALCTATPAQAGNQLDTGGLTFLDFATPDNGASFHRGDGMIAGGPNQVSSRVLGVETGKGLARIRFEQIRVTLAVPLGWQATEDWERGVAYSSDKRYRLVVWRVDFEFEGVKDAEHYASSKGGAIQSRRPAVKAQARKLGDGTYLVVFENVPKGQGDSEPRTVFDLVIPQPGNSKRGALLTLGVPASDAGRGIKLLALLKENMKMDW
ncbi:MAG: hypothetical protein Q8L22_13985 [Reyranella sp.]|nr:hypothetical protein [Reyranella sp.]